MGVCVRGCGVWVYVYMGVWYVCVCMSACVYGCMCTGMCKGVCVCVHWGMGNLRVCVHGVWVI